MGLKKVTLQGVGVVLEPVAIKHYNDLVDVIYDGELWTMSETVIPHPDELMFYIHKAERQFLNGQDLVFSIRDVMTRKISGCTRLRRIDFKNKRAVIGPTFIGKSWQGSYINTESKYLLLKFAFEAWQLNRIEMLCDVLNERSRHAIEKLGATQEGIIRSHRVTPDGRVRNSAVYSILREEWPEVKHNLEGRLQQYGYALSA